MTISRNSKKHITRLSIGAIAAAIALYGSICTHEYETAIFQMVSWTFFVFAVLATELRRSLKSRTQGYIALGIGVLHLLFLYLVRSMFPLQSFLTALVYMVPETAVLGFLYARIGQSLDPAGPFGLTEEDRKRRDLPRWKV